MPWAPTFFYSGLVFGFLGADWTSGLVFTRGGCGLLGTTTAESVHPIPNSRQQDPPSAQLAIFPRSVPDPKSRFYSPGLGRWWYLSRIGFIVQDGQ